MSPERLRSFCRPGSIALVGATDSSRWSINTFQNLKNFGYPGSIFCVNPNREIVHGEQAVKRLGDIEQPVDLAFIMVSTQQVYPILEETAAAGISNVVVLTSGFSEMGARGQELEQKILAFAQDHNMVMLGPNGNGFVNILDQIMPYGLPIQPRLVKGPGGMSWTSAPPPTRLMALAPA